MKRAQWLGWAFFFVLASGCGKHESGTKTWRVAIEEIQGSVQHAYVTELKKRIEDRSGRRVRVQIFPYGTLGTSDELTEQLHGGVLDLAMGSPGHMGKFLPPLQVFLLHFVLTGDPEVNERALRDPEVVAILDRLYQSKGFKFLAAFSEGAMAWTANRPLRTPTDFEGLKMRVMASPLLIASYEAYGASPALVPYSEVYSALQLSMIDAQVNPVFAIQEMSFYEVNDHIIFPGHAPFVATFMANAEFYESLPSEDRALLNAVVAEISPFIRETEGAFNRDRLEIIRDKRPKTTIITLSEEERRPFRERAQKVQEAFVRETGKDGRALLDALKSAVARAQ